MVSASHSFLFIHIPRTGGNSIQAVLSDWSDDEIVAPLEHLDGVVRFGIAHDRYGYSKHAPLDVYRSELPGETYDRLFKFSVLRDPWERMISLYFSPHRGSVEWDRDAFEQLVDDVPPSGTSSASDLCGSGSPLGSIGSAFPGPQRLYGNLDRHIDALLRFERLAEDFDRVRSKFSDEIEYGGYEPPESSSLQA